MTDGLRFVKMTGAGNDFLVLGQLEIGRLPEDPTRWIQEVSRRRFSVGSDGVLFVEPVGVNRVSVRFHNPDGSRAFCGNGSRCAARFAHMRGYAGSRMVLETDAGELDAEILGDRVRLVLPPPVDLGQQDVETDGQTLRGRAIVAGVPHFVIEVEDVDVAPLELWGPKIRRHPDFGPAGTNLDLTHLRPDGLLAIRTWERGVEGETLACGSGALAAAFAARLTGAGELIRLMPASGVPLEVELPGPAIAPESAVLSGDARVIFEGVLTPR